MNLIFKDQHLLMVRQEQKLILPLNEQLRELDYIPSLITNPNVETLGWIEEDGQLALFPELELVSLRYALGLFDLSQINLIISAQQLIYYQQTHKFCGRCGTKTEYNPITSRLSCACSGDIYPRISPAMIVAITRGDQLLMAQANHFPATMWSLLAGFCEAGESLEETVEREVLEEVGITVKNIRYWGSQYWPFPNSLMVGYTAEYASGEIVLDHNEMRAAGFYPKDKLPGRPSSSLSIASRMIDAFVAGEF